MAKRADAKDRVIREQSRLLKYIVEYSSLKPMLSEGFVIDAERVLVEAKVLLAGRAETPLTLECPHGIANVAECAVCTGLRSEYSQSDAKAKP